VEKLQDYFCSAPVFKIHGRQWPVEIYHTKAPVPDYIGAVADTVMQIHMKETAGDILVFLPGDQQAQEVHEILDQKTKGLEKMPYKLIICPIYAYLPVDLLAKTLKAATPSDRKVILVNDIAKVPPTVDGIEYVIDTGFCTTKSYNPHLGIEYLLICPISKASAKGRAGIYGLTRPQKCYRLYTRDSYIHDLEGCTGPEIQRSNLAPMILILKALGINDLVHFPYLDPPPTEAMVKALNQIYGLGALNSRGQLTKTGRRMLEFPLDPLLSKMIVASEKYSCSVEAITIASMLSIGKSIFCCPKNRKGHADLAWLNFHTGNVGDHIALLNVLFSACLLS
jgi:pre-mRNA-splicing factor ATP-dependent RNA helicase DHX16